MIYFNESFLRLHWDEGTSLIWAEWKEVVEGEPMRRGLSTALDLIVQKRARRWLADTRRLGAVPADDVKWINEYWIPRAIAGGLRWMAFVMPTKVVAKLTVKSVVSRINDKDLRTSYFDNVEEARTWLRAQP